MRGENVSANAQYSDVAIAASGSAAAQMMGTYITTAASRRTIGGGKGKSICSSVLHVSPAFEDKMRYRINTMEPTSTKQASEAA